MLLPLLASSLLLSPFLNQGPTQEEQEEHGLPTVILKEDDTIIHGSCFIKIPKGLIIPDLNGNGVIQIQGKQSGGKKIRVRFTQGSVLRGAPTGTPWNTLKGMGISAKNIKGLQLSGLRVHGYKVGIYVQNCANILIQDLDASDNFRQRLGSTPLREDPGDWLFPHDNDKGEWRKKWGAALYLEQCEQLVLRRIRVRRGQNGIILDRVQRARVYDNDCSFLSGWGLALWRSSHNIITRNAFDFCVRGYSHGIYNRGQDSAGILMFEQCKENLIAENSVTHGGDGFFGNSGKEALGQNPGPSSPHWSYKGQGNRDNIYYKNDFSYAAAHGFEQTFSFHETILQNRIVGNAICGIWGGYSQNMRILDNRFEANGDKGYGLERGGINIEHGKDLRILRNHFFRNRCGIHLWVDPDEGLKKLPWVQSNPETGSVTWIVQNRFEGDAIALQLRGGVSGVHFFQNQRNGVSQAFLLEDQSKLDKRPSDPKVWDVSLPPQALGPILGNTQPVGARKPLRGRHNILMGPWGPWDHASPFLRARRRSPQALSWDLFGVTKSPTIKQKKGLAQELRIHKESPKHFRLSLPIQGKGVLSYAFILQAENYRFPVQGKVLNTQWKVRFFPWKTDPRKNYATWIQESRDQGLVANLPSLHLRYGMAGPASLHLSKEISEKLPAKDHFGTIATTTIPLSKGKWILQTKSDDGIRVWVNGTKLIDDWTLHGPTKHDASFTLSKRQAVSIRVEHFELDGYALLELDVVEDQK